MLAVPERLSHEELLQQFKLLQARVSSFSAKEQQLINAKDRLDSEVELHRRMHTFNTSAFRVHGIADFLRLVAESIIDIFEIEMGLVFLGDAQLDHPYLFALEGGQHCIKDAGLLWQQLRTQLSVSPSGKMMLADYPLLASMQPQANLHQLVWVSYTAKSGAAGLHMLAAIGSSNAFSYNGIDAYRQNAFEVFAQQVLAHFNNHQKSRNIDESKGRLSEIAHAFLNFGADPYANIQRLIDLSIRLLKADAAFYYPQSDSNVIFGEQKNASLVHFPITLNDMKEMAQWVQSANNHATLFNFTLPFSNLVVPAHLPKTHVHYTGMGIQVQLAGYNSGQLCVCYETDRQPSEEDQHFLGIIATAIAVEENRQRAATALADEEQRYRVIFEGAPHGIVLVDAASGNIVYANPAICDLFQYSFEAFLQIAISQLHPKGISNSYLSELVHGAKTGFTLGAELQCLRKDGVVFFADLSAREIVLGRKTFFVCFYVDVTERKEAEDELVANNTQLKKINSELDNFVYSVSHDLRSPLLAIKGLMSLFDKDQPNSKENNEYWLLIKDSINRMDETIHEILDYSRNSKLNPTIEALDLAQIAIHAFEDVKYSVQEAITFEMDINTSKKLFSDKARVNTVVRNVVSNAVKYRKVGAADNHIKVEYTHAADGSSCLKVSDKGEGIAPSDTTKVFEMFYRASHTVAGSGLGLYICKEIMEKLGGSISLTSELGIGTVVLINFPNQSEIV